MVKTYVVFRDTIKELLDHLEEFQVKMELFCKTHPEYSYNVSISECSTKKRSQWQLMTNIERNDNIKENKSRKSIT